jgi:hypothetical protein
VGDRLLSADKSCVALREMRIGAGAGFEGERREPSVSPADDMPDAGLPFADL